MKRACLLIWGALFASMGWSQTMNIHYKSGQTVEYNMDNIDYIEFTKRSNNDAQVSSGKAVDLGLSVKWASCNVGATSPEEFGDKFAWGETETKERFELSNYLYYDSFTESYIDIGLDIKGTDYDVAHVKWGANWRMPTFDELKELKEKCDWKWGQYNGVNGYIVTGSNGNSIFFPSGYGDYNCLWASHILSSNSHNEEGKSKMAACLGIKYDSIGNSVGFTRQAGLYVRPVLSK